MLRPSWIGLLLAIAGVSAVLCYGGGVAAQDESEIEIITEPPPQPPASAPPPADAPSTEPPPLPPPPPQPEGPKEPLGHLRVGGGI
ncbi:MAG: hypothetical protein WBN29_18685, partial [Polyangiales bacterium]